MGEILQFTDYHNSCKMCANLLRVGKNTYTCTVMEWEDGTDLYPIEDGQKTVGYNVCDGEKFKKRGIRYGKRNSV